MRLAHLKEQYHLDMAEATAGITAKYNLAVTLAKLSEANINVVSSKQFYTDPMTREGAYKFITEVQDYLAPITIKDSKYSTYYDRDKDSKYYEIYPVTISIDSYDVTVHAHILLDGKKVSFSIELTDAESEVQVEQDYEECEVRYYNCTLQTNVESNVQVYGTHARGLRRYTMWFDCQEDPEDSMIYFRNVMEEV